MPKLVARRQVGWRELRSTPGSLALVDSMPSGQPESDVGGFAEIAEQHRPMLHRVALRLSGNAEIAKDLVQETLLRALRRFDQFQQGTHAATWLVAIMTNLYLDHIKHEKVVRKAEPELVISEAVECESTIAEIADADLYAAVQALDPELRDVVELCYFTNKHEAKLIKSSPGLFARGLVEGIHAAAALA